MCTLNYGVVHIGSQKWYTSVPMCYTSVFSAVRTNLKDPEKPPASDRIDADDSETDNPPGGGTPSKETEPCKPKQTNAGSAPWTAPFWTDRSDAAAGIQTSDMDSTPKCLMCLLVYWKFKKFSGGERRPRHLFHCQYSTKLVPWFG
jgi:hypothetical protein